MGIWRKVSIFHQIQGAISSLYYERHITPVIILDEIHLVTNKILEDLRLLFNFKMEEIYYPLVSTHLKQKNSVKTGSRRW